MKFEYKVEGMSCQHCVRAITQAVQQLDPNAAVTVDLPRHKVVVDTSADSAAVVAAIEEEGYQVQ